jgi:hypothetical protein
MSKRKFNPTIIMSTRVDRGNTVTVKMGLYTLLDANPWLKIDEDLIVQALTSGDSYYLSDAVSIAFTKGSALIQGTW